MLRGILRNVQYLFLFFSVLLVFLALQRLQYLPRYHYDNNFYYLGDGGGDSYFGIDNNKAENELKSLFYYRGDETREIGLRSFRVGVFKFILPSFSSSSASSASSTYSSSSSAYRSNNNNHENRNHRMTAVPPPPPNDRPKSVAYNIIMQSTIVNNVDDHDEDDGRGANYHHRAKILSKSIQQMHANSKYDYRLYALTTSATNYSNKELLPSSSSAVTNNKGGNDKNRKRNELLSNLGFEIVDGTIFEGKEYDADLKIIGRNTDESSSDTSSTPLLLSSESKQLIMHKIWRRHHIIVNLIGMEKMHSTWTLDRFYDTLLSRSNDEGVNIFLLKPPHHKSYYNTTNGGGRSGEIVIFIRSYSRRQSSFETYIKFLSCSITTTAAAADKMFLFDDETLWNITPNDVDDTRSDYRHQQCIHQKSDSDQGIALCTYHEDYIDCSDSL